MRLKRMSIPRNPPPETPDDRMYLYMKRLLLTMGPEAVRAYLIRKGLEATGLLKGFVEKYQLDNERSDVGTGKCLNCLFNRNCMQSPTGCAFINAKMPLRKLSFTVYDSLYSKWTHTYDCGWMLEKDELLEKAVMPDEIDICIGKNDIVWLTRPFHTGVSPYHAIPKKGETWKVFTKRVEDVVRQIINGRNAEKSSGKACLRQLLVRLGHKDELRDNYGDDVMFMASDYWPGKTVEEILDMYVSTSKEGVTPEEYLSKRRAIEKERTNETQE